VSAASLRLWNSEFRSAGSCQTERVGSSQYQRSEKPCQALRERPSLNEKATAMATGRIDQAR
jgi:hypothetical protein